MNKGLLDGQVAVITGAGSGIGRAAALRFAEEGASVVTCDITGAEGETADMIAAAGGRAVAQKMDAGNEGDVSAAVALAQSEFGGLNAFFANAGITGTPTGEEFLDHTPEIWAEVLRVNLIGPYLAIKHAAPVMQAAGGGSIIATASVAGIRANAGPVAYSASKAGVMNLVQTSAQELRGSNVRINAICPGLIETGMTKMWYELARMNGAEDKMGQSNPMLRGGNPEEVANVALFLASDLASYVNGQSVAVDGGLSSGHPFGKKLDREVLRKIMAAQAAQAATADAGKA